MEDRLAPAGPAYLALAMVVAFDFAGGRLVDLSALVDDDGCGHQLGYELLVVANFVAAQPVALSGDYGLEHYSFADYLKARHKYWAQQAAAFAAQTDRLDRQGYI